MYCQNCGSAISANARFCESCGQPQSAVPTPIVPTPHPAQISRQDMQPIRRPKSMMFWFSMVGISLAIIAGVIGSPSDNSSKEPSTPPKPTQSDAQVSEEWKAKHPEGATRAPVDLNQAKASADPKQGDQERDAYAQSFMHELTDRGFDILVYARSHDPGGPVLVLDSEMFKDTDTRVQFIGIVLPASTKNLCPLGFRQVRLKQGGTFEFGHDYSLGCKGRWTVETQMASDNPRWPGSSRPRRGGRVRILRALCGTSALCVQRFF
jgi:hypothetical protein